MSLGLAHALKKHDACVLLCSLENNNENTEIRLIRDLPSTVGFVAN